MTLGSSTSTKWLAHSFVFLSSFISPFPLLHLSHPLYTRHVGNVSVHHVASDWTFLAKLHQCVLQYSREKNTPLKLQEAVLGNRIQTEAVQKRYWDLTDHNESHRQDERKRPLSESESERKPGQTTAMCKLTSLKKRIHVLVSFSEFFLMFCCTSEQDKWKSCVSRAGLQDTFGVILWQSMLILITASQKTTRGWWTPTPWSATGLSE